MLDLINANKIFFLSNVRYTSFVPKRELNQLRLCLMKWLSLIRIHILPLVWTCQKKKKRYILHSMLFKTLHLKHSQTQNNMYVYIYILKIFQHSVAKILLIKQIKIIMKKKLQLTIFFFFKKKTKGVQILKNLFFIKKKIKLNYIYTHTHILLFSNLYEYFCFIEILG